MMHQSMLAAAPPGSGQIPESTPEYWDRVKGDPLRFAPPNQGQKVLKSLSGKTSPLTEKETDDILQSLRSQNQFKAPAEKAPAAVKAVPDFRARAVPTLGQDAPTRKLTPYS